MGKACICLMSAAGAKAGVPGLEALARAGGTVAFYQGAGDLERICEGLVGRGVDAKVPAALVHWGPTSRQRVVTGTVADVLARAARAGVEPPALVLVGEAVAMWEAINRLDGRPLFGRRIVATEPRPWTSALAEELERRGAQVAGLTDGDDPAAPFEAGEVDWVTFLCPETVEAFLRVVPRERLGPGRPKLASIDPPTSQKLRDHGLGPSAEARPYTIAGLVEAMLAWQEHAQAAS